MVREQVCCCGKFITACSCTDVANASPATATRLARLRQRNGTLSVRHRGPDAKVLEVLETRVSKDRLTVKLRPGVRVTSTATIRVTVSGDRVSALEANEAANIDATGLTGSPVRLTATGGSSIVASGVSDAVRLNASGASFIDATGLEASAVSVDASGGSKIDLKATSTVVGTASGGSEVTVTGGADASGISLSGGSNAQ